MQKRVKLSDLLAALLVISVLGFALRGKVGAILISVSSDGERSLRSRTPICFEDTPEHSASLSCDIFAATRYCRIYPPIEDKSIITPALRLLLPLIVYPNQSKC